MSAGDAEVVIDLTQRTSVRRRWGRVDVLNAGPPSPPTIGCVSEGVYLLTRGRRHNVYGHSETGKSRFGYLIAGQEVAAGHAVVILNGEMEDEDVLDWLRTCDPSPGSDDIEAGLFVYPTDGLLTEEQRRIVLTEVAASGRVLTYVLADSQTSLLSEAGLDPNKSEDIERLWTELGLWFTGLPDRPAFVMTDHLSKDSDGSTPTGSIRKHSVVDVAYYVHNAQPFSPATQYGPAVSGFSTVQITKGRRGARGTVVARIVGHEGRVSLASPYADVPWATRWRETGEGAGEVTADVLKILGAAADAPRGTGSDGLLERAGMKGTAGYALLAALAVDETAVGPSSLMFRRKEGKAKVPMLTERGRAVLAEHQEKT